MELFRVFHSFIEDTLTRLHGFLTIGSQILPDSYNQPEYPDAQPIMNFTIKRNTRDYVHV